VACGAVIGIGFVGGKRPSCSRLLFHFGCGISRASGRFTPVWWWDERKVVSPRQDGHKRVYEPEEVVEISVIAELGRKGFSLQKIPAC